MMDQEAPTVSRGMERGAVFAVVILAFSLVALSACKRPMDGQVSGKKSSGASVVMLGSAEELPAGYIQETLVPEGLVASPGEVVTLDGREMQFVEARHIKIEDTSQLCFLSTTVWAPKQNLDDKYSRSLFACMESGQSQAQVLMRGGLEGNGSLLLYVKDLTGDGYPELITARQESTSPVSVAVYQVRPFSALAEIAVHRPSPEGEDKCLDEFFDGEGIGAQVTVCDWADEDPSFQPQRYFYKYEEASHSFQVHAR